jgi:transcriptional regulator with XRE-family HTH domain
MSKRLDAIIKRIKYTRKISERSKQDCARILGISKESYHIIESGKTPITLPQIELLSIFLGLKLSDLLEEKPPQTPHAIVLKDDIRPHYLTLRDKMIRAMLSIELENQSLTLEDVAQATQISLLVLQRYDSGEEPVSMDNLLKISDYLGISIDTLYEPIGLFDKQRETSSVSTDWQPEFADVETQKSSTEDDHYVNLLKAFRRIPMVDQAHIAKTILEKLKSV